MTYKHIEASREIRLWIAQVIVPAIALLGIPEVRKVVATKAKSLKETIKQKKEKGS